MRDKDKQKIFEEAEGAEIHISDRGARTGMTTIPHSWVDWGTLTWYIYLKLIEQN